MPESKESTVYDSAQFIARIRNFVNQGYGFVPLIGSGMSAPSGILMGQDFTDFMSYTTYLVLCSPADRRIERFSSKDAQWNIGVDGWPNYPTETEMKEVKKWVLQEFKTMCEKHGFETIIADGAVIQVNKTEGVNPNHVGSSELLASLSRPFVPELINSAYTGDAESVSRRLLKLIYQESDIRTLPEIRGRSTTSQRFVLEEGLCSLYDWRATLAFLARTGLSDLNDHQQRKVTLRKEPDPAIVDSFNIHITSGKRFNLGHKMLAHLARPMRIRTTLTTNFDDLIERAFQTIHKPLISHSVSMQGGLPDPKTVRAEDCIVHLHGTKFETRADFTLDSEPNTEDKERFTQYLLGPGVIFGQQQHGQPKVVSSHLLIVGFSASDHRCNQMIKHLLDTDPNVRVFWVCFSGKDIENIRRRFSEDDYHARILLHRNDRPDLLLYELYQHLTLCLPGGGFAYEFSHNVPPRRFDTTNTTNHPESVSDLRNALKPDIDVDLLELGVDLRTVQMDPELSAKLHAREAVSSKLADLVVSAIVSKTTTPLVGGMKSFARLGYRKVKKPKKSKTLVVDVASGAASSLGIAFRTLKEEHEKNCIWIELQDFSDPISVVKSIFQIISLRLGRYQLEHVPLMPSIETPIDNAGNDSLVAHLKGLMNYFNQEPGQWVLFLYGRNGPGACSGWDNKNWKEENEEGKEDPYKDLEDILDVLDSVGLKTIYAPLTKQRANRDQEKVLILRDDDVPANDLVERIGIFYGVVKTEDKRECDIETKVNGGFVTDAAFPFDPKEHCHHSMKIVDEPDFGQDFPLQSELSIYEHLMTNVAEKWLMKSAEDRKADHGKEYEDKMRFLYTLTLFRQSRHPSAFFSEAVYSCPFRFNISGIDNDWTRAEKVKKWVAELGEMRILYQKSGGYCWKHRDVRLGLQLLLQSLPLKEYKDKYKDDDGNNKEKEIFPHDSLLEARSRFHYWIADWYLKAFTTTGHAIPVIESLYHGFQCAKYAQFAKPRRKLNQTMNEEALSYYRLTRFHSAIQGMTKLLHLSRTWLKFWRASPNDHAMFAEDAETKIRLIEYLDAIESHQDTGELRASIRKKIDEFEEVRKELGKTLANEATKVSRIDTHFAARSGREPFLDDDYPVDTSPNKVGVVNWKELFANTKCEGLVKALAIADNMNVDSKNSRDKVIQIMHDGIEECLGWREDCKGIGWLWKNCDNDPNLFEFVDTVSKIASLHKLRAKMEFHAGENDLSNSPRQHHPALWLKVTALCNTGLDAVRYLSASYLEDEIEFRYHLHSTYAIALANLDRYFEAHRHLNEAMALLSKSSHPTNESHIILGIIRLRRAEVYLTEALRLKEIRKQEHSLMRKFEKVSKKVTELSEKVTKLEEKIPKATPEDKEKIKEEKGELEKLKTEQEKLKKQQLQKTAFEKKGDPAPPNDLYSFPVTSRQEEKELRVADLVINPVVYSFYKNPKGVKYTLERRKRLLKMLRRRHTACLDDAYSEIELARKLFSGKSQSSHWWGSYFALKLRIYGAQYKESHDDENQRKEPELEPLIYRQRIEHGSQVIGLLKQGLLAFPDNSYEGLRIIDYFVKAWNVVSNRDEASGHKVLAQEVKDRILDAFKQYETILDKYETPHLVTDYRKKVQLECEGMDIKFPKMEHQDSCKTAG